MTAHGALSIIIPLLVSIVTFACDAWVFETKHQSERVATLKPVATCVVVEPGGDATVAVQAVDDDGAAVNGVPVTVVLTPDAGFELLGVSEVPTARRTIGELAVEGAVSVDVSAAEESASSAASLAFHLSDRATVATQVRLRRSPDTCDGFEPRPNPEAEETNDEN